MTGCPGWAEERDEPMTQAEDGRTGRPGPADETMPPGEGRRQWSVPTDPMPSGSTPAAGAAAPAGGGRRRLLIILGALIAALILVIAAVVLLRDTEPAPQAAEVNPNGWGDPAAEYLEPPFQSDGDKTVRSADYPKWDLFKEGMMANQVTPRDTAFAVNGAFRAAMREAADNAAPGDPMPERLEGIVTDDGDEFECRISSADKYAAWWECRGPASPEGLGQQAFLSPQPQMGMQGKLIPGDPDWAPYVKEVWKK